LRLFRPHAVEVLNDILLEVPGGQGRAKRERKEAVPVSRKIIVGAGSNIVFPMFARAGSMGKVGMRGAAGAKACAMGPGHSATIFAAGSSAMGPGDAAVISTTTAAGMASTTATTTMTASAATSATGGASTAASTTAACRIRQDGRTSQEQRGEKYCEIPSHGGDLLLGRGSIENVMPAPCPFDAHYP
jgi:hypothetical protein